MWPFKRKEKAPEKKDDRDILGVSSEEFLRMDTDQKSKHVLKLWKKADEEWKKAEDAWKIF